MDKSFRFDRKLNKKSHYYTLEISKWKGPFIFLFSNIKIISITKIVTSDFLNSLNLPS